MNSNFKARMRDAFYMWLCCVLFILFFVGLVFLAVLLFHNPLVAIGAILTSVVVYTIKGLL